MPLPPSVLVVLVLLIVRLCTRPPGLVEAGHTYRLVTLVDDASERDLLAHYTLAAELVNDFGIGQGIGDTDSIFYEAWGQHIGDLNGSVLIDSADSGCDAEAAMLAFYNLTVARTHRAVGVLGPQCSTGAAAVASMIDTVSDPSQTLPMVSPAAPSRAMREFSFFTRLAGHSEIQATLLSQLAAKFGWSNIGILWQDGDTDSEDLAQQFNSTFRGNVPSQSAFDSGSHSSMKTALERAQTSGTRVMLVCAQPSAAASVLKVAVDVGLMVGNGQTWLGTEWAYWGLYDSVPAASQSALVNASRGFIGLRPLTNTSTALYQAYEAAWKEATNTSTKHLNPYAARAVDSVIAYAMAMRDVLNVNNLDPSAVSENGAALSEAVGNVSFRGLSGWVEFSPTSSSSSPSLLTAASKRRGMERVQAEFEIVNAAGSSRVWDVVGTADNSSGISISTPLVSPLGVQGHGSDTYDVNIIMVTTGVGFEPREDEAVLRLVLSALNGTDTTNMLEAFDAVQNVPSTLRWFPYFLFVNCSQSDAVATAVAHRHRFLRAHAIVGPFCSSIALSMTQRAASIGLPTISFMATSDSLTDAPLFARTVPADRFQASLLAAVFDDAGWDMVSVIYTASSEYSSNLLAQLTDVSGVEFAETVSVDTPNPSNKVKQLLSSVHEGGSWIVALLTPSDIAAGVLEAADNSGLLSAHDGYVWVGVDSWVDTWLTDAYANLTQGGVGTAPFVDRSTDQYRSLLNAWQANNDTTADTDGNLSTMALYAPHAADAVLAAAIAFSESITSNEPMSNGTFVHNTLTQQRGSGAPLSFKGASGFVELTAAGDRSPLLALYNIRAGGGVARVGIQHGDTTTLDTDAIMWPDGTSTPPVAIRETSTHNDDEKNSNGMGQVVLILQIAVALAVVLLVASTLIGMAYTQRKQERAELDALDRGRYAAHAGARRRSSTETAMRVVETMAREQQHTHRREDEEEAEEVDNDEEDHGRPSAEHLAAGGSDALRNTNHGGGGVLSLRLDVEDDHSSRTSAARTLAGQNDETSRIRVQGLFHLASIEEENGSGAVDTSRAFSHPTAAAGSTPGGMPKPGWRHLRRTNNENRSATDDAAGAELGKTRLGAADEAETDNASVGSGALSADDATPPGENGSDDDAVGGQRSRSSGITPLDFIVAAETAEEGYDARIDQAALHCMSALVGLPVEPDRVISAQTFRLFTAYFSVWYQDLVFILISATHLSLAIWEQASTGDASTKPSNDTAVLLLAIELIILCFYVVDVFVHWLLFPRDTFQSAKYRVYVALILLLTVDVVIHIVVRSSSPIIRFSRPFRAVITLLHSRPMASDLQKFYSSMVQVSDVALIIVVVLFVFSASAVVLFGPDIKNCSVAEHGDTVGLQNFGSALISFVILTSGDNMPDLALNPYACATRGSVLLFAIATLVLFVMLSILLASLFDAWSTTRATQANHFLEAERLNLQQAFAVLSRSHPEGGVSKQDWKALLERIQNGRIVLPDEFVEDTFRVVDSDGNGVLDESEFVHVSSILLQDVQLISGEAVARHCAAPTVADSSPVAADRASMSPSSPSLSPGGGMFFIGSPQPGSGSSGSGGQGTPDGRMTESRRRAMSFNWMLRLQYQANLKLRELLPGHRELQDFAYSNPWCLLLSLLCNLLNGALLVQYTAANRTYWWAFNMLDYVFMVVSVGEVAFRLYAVGWQRYIKRSYRKVDTVLVLLSSLGVFVFLLAGMYEVSTSLRFLRVARIAITVDMLAKYYNWDDKMKTRGVIMRLWAAGPVLLRMILLVFVFLYFFAILGMELFSGILAECDAHTGRCESKVPGYQTPDLNFNSFLRAISFLCVLAVDTDLANVIQSSLAVKGPIAGVYWLAVYITLLMLLLNLFYATTIDAYTHLHRKRRTRTKYHKATASGSVLRVRPSNFHTRYRTDLDVVESRHAAQEAAVMERNMLSRVQAEVEARMARHATLIHSSLAMHSLHSWRLSPTNGRSSGAHGRSNGLHAGLASLVHRPPRPPSPRAPRRRSRGSPAAIARKQFVSTHSSMETANSSMSDPVPCPLGPARDCSTRPSQPSVSEAARPRVDSMQSDSSTESHNGNSMGDSVGSGIALMPRQHPPAPAFSEHASSNSSSNRRRQDADTKLAALTPTIDLETHV